MVVCNMLIDVDDFDVGLYWLVGMLIKILGCFDLVMCWVVLVFDCDCDVIFVELGFVGEEVYDECV